MLQPVFLQVVEFWHGRITCKNGIFYLQRDACEKAPNAVTCATCSLPVKTVKFTCSYAASTSHRIDAIARYKARKFRVTSPAGCKLTYLQLAGEFSRGVIADCLQLQVFSGAIAGIFARGCACIFACVCSYFCLLAAGIFICYSSVFACKRRRFAC